MEPIVVLIGPTAIGKTALSIQLAQQFDFEIISVDSMQVYKYMDIGTAKITEEEMQGIPHHLIDIVSPDEDFDAVTFEKLALAAICDIHARKKRVLLTGGTGLYLRSLLEGLSRKLPVFPEIRKEIQEELERDGCEKLHEQLSIIDQTSAKRIHRNDTHRLLRALEIFRGVGKKWSDLIAEHENNRQLRFKNSLIIGLRCDRQLLYERIGQRSEMMIKSGFQEEVEGLLARGYDDNCKSMRSIGYSHMLNYLNGRWDHANMLEKLTRDTRRYAKRQFTWFNKISDIYWFDTGDCTPVPSLIESFQFSVNTAS